MNYSEKLRQTNREALMTLVALVFVAAVWLVCGFGLSGLNIQIFHLPLWVVGGLLGTWIAAIVCSIVLARLFKNFDLDEEELRPDCDIQLPCDSRQESNPYHTNDLNQAGTTNKTIDLGKSCDVSQIDNLCQKNTISQTKIIAQTCEAKSTSCSIEECYE